LGVNGEDFLIYTAKMLEDEGYKDQQESSENGQVELPGVTGCKIEMKPVPSYPQGSKPWWWYLWLSHLVLDRFVWSSWNPNISVGDGS
jgi:hypothetical protein